MAASSGEASLEKDEAIKHLVGEIRRRFPRVAPVDHWEADLHAIGLVSESAPGRLLYVNSFNQPPGTFTVVCETDVGGRIVDQSTDERLALEQVIAKVIDHLMLNTDGRPIGT